MNNCSMNIREAEDIIDSAPGSLVYKGTFTVFLVIIILLIFLAVVRYPDRVCTSVRIDAEKPIYQISTHSSGIIDTILISEGECALVGQPIIMLRNTISFNDYLRVKNAVSVLQKQGSAATSKNISKIMEFNFGGEIRDELDDLYSILAEYDVFVKDQSVNLEIKQKYREAENLNSTLTLKRGHYSLRSEESEISHERFKKDSILCKRGVISDNELKISKQQFLKIQQQQYSLLEEISQLEKESYSMVSNAGILEVRHDTERKLFLSRIEAAVNKLSSSLEKWETKYLISTQINGEVVLRNGLFAGKYYQQGEHLASIIPFGNRQNIANLSVSGYGRGKIKTGQKIIITLDAYPVIDFGTITTSVGYISEVPVNGKYLISASLPDTIITSFKKTIQLHTELQGSAEIITESHSILHRVTNIFRLKSKYF